MVGWLYCFMPKPIFPRAVLFDLLTALLNSCTFWNAVAGCESERRGRGAQSICA